MKKTIPIIIALILIVGGGAFYGGMKYGQSKSPAGFDQLSDGQRQQIGAGTGLRGGNPESGGFVSGEIIAKDENSLTVKLQDGGSKIVFFSDSTAISKMTEGVSADIAVGEQIMVTGAKNDDGSYTAKTIQLSPNFQNR